MERKGFFLMSTDFMFLFDVISLVAGFYCVITFIKLRLAGGRLFPNSLLVPKGLAPKDCLDGPGYVKYIGPRILILGIVMLVQGALSAINSASPYLSILAYNAMMGVCFVVIVWYAVCSVKANKKFWIIPESTTPGRRL